MLICLPASADVAVLLTFLAIIPKFARVGARMCREAGGKVVIVMHPRDGRRLEIVVDGCKISDTPVWICELA